MSWYPSDPTGRCVVQNSANFSYEDFACLYEKSIGMTMTPFEANYNPIYVRDWMRENPWVPVVAILGYGAMIAIGKTYFRNRDAWSWRTTLALWNFGLSLFSFIGFCRVAPQLVHNLYHYSLSENLCFDPEQMFGSDRMVGTWVQLFILSKFPYVWLVQQDAAILEEGENEESSLSEGTATNFGPCNRIISNSPFFFRLSPLCHLATKSSTPLHQTYRLFCSHQNTENLSTPFSSSFTKSHSSFYTGTTTFPSWRTAGTAMSPRHQLESSFAS